jgi:hypothetical protein
MRHGFIESGMDECGKRAILLRNYYCMMTIGNGGGATCGGDFPALSISI